MNLEAIEQCTLHFLKQSRNPLVPFDQLVEHLQRDADLGAFTEAELLAFLRHHELFDVVEPIRFDLQQLDGAELAEAALHLTPHVILTTRVPTERQMAEHMSRQLNSLVKALNSAMVAAKESGQSGKVQELIRLVARAQTLQSRVAKFV